MERMDGAAEFVALETQKSWKLETDSVTTHSALLQLQSSCLHAPSPRRTFPRMPATPPQCRFGFVTPHRTGHPHDCLCLASTFLQRFGSHFWGIAAD